MRSFVLVVLTFALVSANVYGQGTEKPRQLRVLFIGNSYTFRLPEAVAGIAKANGRTLHFKTLAKGGWTLKQHAGSKATIEAIRSNVWDYVVLQEQSQIPSFSEAQRNTDMYPYAEKLSSEIRKAKAKTLFFVTWGRKDGDKQNVPGDSYARMQERLRQGYSTAAKRCSATSVPVGDAWALGRSKNGFDLYQGDGSHPSTHGRTLSAFVFFRFLFQTKVASDPKLPRDLSAKDAKILRDIANSLKLGS